MFSKNYILLPIKKLTLMSPFKPSAEKKKFLDWISRNPNCAYIRNRADKALAIRDLDNPDPNERIKVFHIPPRKKKKNFFKLLIHNIWVPGYKLRGKEWTNRSWDDQLNQTSSIMSFSGVFDMLCMSPILFYLTKAAGIFALPISLVYGFLLLIISNKAGEFSMNRTRENSKAATFLLMIFFLLSMLKTVMSGVGIDLISRSNEIKNSAAQKYLQTTAGLYKNKNTIYNKVLESSTNECNKLIDKQSQLNTSRRAQRKLYTDLQDKMYKKPVNPKSQDPKYLLENHVSELGPCLKRDLINNINESNTFDGNKAYSTQQDILNKSPAMTSLYIFQRNKYNELFTGNPLIGSKMDYSKYEKIFKDSPITFNIDCTANSKECNKPVAWNNSGKVVNEGWNQFYGRILNKDWENLGLSYIGFLISILLSASATVLLYTASIDIRNRASRSSLVKQWRSEYLAALDDEDIDDISEK